MTARPFPYNSSNAGWEEDMRDPGGGVNTAHPRYKHTHAHTVTHVVLNNHFIITSLTCDKLPSHKFHTTWIITNLIILRSAYTYDKDENCVSDVRLRAT